MSQTPSRRSLLTLAASATIGSAAACLELNNDPRNESQNTDSHESREEDLDPITPDETQVKFQDWLTPPTDNNSTGRFEYSELLIEQTLQGRASILNIDPDQVDGFLIQLPALIFFGDFDVSKLETSIEDTENYSLTREYESYWIAEPQPAEQTRDDLIASQFALGKHTVLLGRDLERWIDTQNGDREGLTERYSVFTALFDRLPDRTNIVGQLDPPPTWDIEPDILEGWGSSLPSYDGDSVTQTWVYALTDQPTAEHTRIIEQNLSESVLSEGIDQTDTDGQFLTVSGTVSIPEIDD